MILSKNKINIIYHLSDIHIRPLERHDEYKNVFKNLYDYLKKDKKKDSLIVICGDLIHEKDKITPELILLLRDFLKNLTTIYPVLLFSGNHDLIENNSERTPNLEALTQDIKNLYYLKYTDLYEFGNIIFSLKSLEDTKDFIKINNKDKIKIALYHGMLKEIPFSNGDYSVEDFNEYDYALLGDIHERQVFNDNVAYSGSLIQQNFGEKINNHGLIKWDLLNKKSQFINILNDYSYLTINNYKELEKIELFTKYTRLRIKTDNENEIEKIRTKINLNSEIISEKIIKFKNKEEKILYEKEFVETINDETIIKNNLKDNVEDILELHKNIKDECDFNTKELSEYQWSILSLEFMNLFIYGDNKINKIDFLSKEGVIGVLGNNAIGKSSLINIIIFALFDKISSEYNNTNIINKNCKKMYVNIEFVINNTNYIITKQGTLQNTSKGIRTKYTTNYKKIENDKTYNLNGKDRIKTKQLIEDTIGIQSIFLLCNIVSNTHSYSLLNMTNSELIKTFSSLFFLDKYEDLYKNISDKIKNLEKIMNIDNGKLLTLKENDIDTDSFEKNINEKINQKNNYNISLKKISKNINNLSNEIKQIKLFDLKKPIKSLDYLNNRKSELLNLIKEKETFDIKSLYFKLHSIDSNKTHDELIKEFKNINKPSFKFTIDNLNDKKIELNTIDNELLELEKKIDNIKRNCKIDKNIKDKNEDLIVLKNNIIELREIKEKKKKNNKIINLKKIKNTIKENEDILFYHSDVIAKESKNLQKELSESKFYKESKFDTKETKIFLNKIDTFLKNIKSEKEIIVIKELIKKNKDLLEINQKIENKNNEIEEYNKNIDKDIFFNEKTIKKNNEINTLILNIEFIRFNKKKNDLKKKKKDITNNINKIEESIKYFEIKNLIDKINENNKTKYLIEQMEYKNELSEINKDIELYLEYNKYIKENEEKEKIKKKLENKLKINNNELIEINSNIAKLTTEINYENNLLNEHKNKKEKYKELIEINNKNKNKLNLFDTYKKLVDKKCIPTLLLKEKLKFIEKDVNSNLISLVNFEIELLIDDNSKFEINIKKFNNILKPYMCSGYEKFILNIMIKNSLNKYSFNNKSNIFFIDEGLDCIDDNNLNKFNIVLDRLRNTYNYIILISQIDRIDKYIDSNILIEYKNNCSYIK